MSAIPLWLWAALASGVVAVLVTRAIERFGGRLGGLLGTIPTTIVPASMGFYVGAPDVDSFRASLLMVPSGMLLSAVFLWIWRVVPPRRPAMSLATYLALTTALSLGVWLALGVAVVAGTAAYRASGGSMDVHGLVVFVLAWVVGLAACWAERPSPAGARPVSWSTLIARSGMAAVAIGLAVGMQAFAGALVAGVFSVFPAIFLTTMLSLSWSQGDAVRVGAVGPMMLGSTSVSAYALIASWTMPAVGPWSGAIVAWIAAVGLVTTPAIALLRARPWARQAV